MTDALLAVLGTLLGLVALVGLTAALFWLGLCLAELAASGYRLAQVGFVIFFVVVLVLGLAASGSTS